MTRQEKIPQGRLGRFARLAAVGARTGAGMLLDRNGESAARHAADVLGTLRGLAAKMGQMASYVDGVVPEAQRDAYEASLRALRAQAPRSSSVAIRAVVEEELGAPIGSLFQRWQDDPIASASIGQVHAATLLDGTEVAVKVQHPGIARAVESDLANAGILEGFAGLAGGKRFQTKAMLEVIRARFREELDYGLEASRLRHFAELHARDRFVKIPRLIDSHSASRVLTTELAVGVTFEQACAAPEAERRAWAEAMWRFVFKGTLIGGMLNADPHPGNYVFQPGGRIVFLDYGCIQEMGERRQAHANLVHDAALACDEARFRRAVTIMVASRPGALEDVAVSYSRRCFQPLFEPPYRITREYAASLMQDMKEMATLARKVKDDEFFPMPPDMLFVNRLQFGFYSVLARLDVEVDYTAVERAFLAEARSVTRTRAHMSA